MKKKISLALSVGVLLTTLSPLQTVANADNVRVVVGTSNVVDRLDVEKYIPKIKSIFQIGDEYNEFETHQFNGMNLIQLTWRNSSGSIGVSIDKDGDIVGYYKSEYGTNSNRELYQFPKLSKKDGEKIAKEFVNKVLPEMADKVKISNDNYDYDMYNLRGYFYKFTRVENDIPFNNQSIYVSVDNQKGEVTDFNLHGQKNYKFPGKEGIISEEEARELYREKVGLELMYKLRGIDSDLEPYLGYSIVDTDKTINAKNKDIESTSYQYRYPISRYSNYVESVSSKDESNLINSKVIISRTDASKKIVDTFSLGDGYEVSGGQLRKIKGEDKYFWDINVMKYEGRNGSGTTVTIDAKTGQIISFSDPGAWGDDKKGEVKYKKEELLKKAEDFIQKNNPEKYKEVEYVESIDILDEYNKTYQFEFIKKLNDIKVENSGFRVGISAITGNIVDYDYNWDDLELPLVENIIDKDKAKEILFNGNKLELQYQSENQDESSAKLVYDFKDKHLVVDAKTGEIIDYKKELGEKLDKKDYKDIENSFAKDQINKLQEYIVLFEGEDFKPKSEIIQKDFLSLLAQVKGLSHDEEYLYESLIIENVIKNEEKNPEGKVTREEAIKYIVRAFGQEQSGNLGDIYKMDYNDADQIDENLKGHVAIAKGLGVISGEGNFRPKDNLRRDEAAVLIYNILNRK
ncbi:S-layer-like domain-containing protein [Gottschalkia acidurici 9a]|uniref:S-layer-like domain-containing protein n=1 Tax=Gottschalkia acidurici (strain ATCC 7906 / DSM 604 / BCRC 14475 / CIP 104303 / KCTC 5404 / NCIMB 10678 / 9a) TaxID=1128398 RepID=K0AWN1_GOTA9|nr:YcdB/YcdC domain-containing protein [Gottschalkia acidurici]AFS77644.1 S-layer-like domain-containing protein [Gottschalkia acidurici 9a]